MACAVLVALLHVGYGCATWGCGPEYEGEAGPQAATHASLAHRNLRTLGGKQC